jgi:hypothetical protein
VINALAHTLFFVLNEFACGTFRTAFSEVARERWHESNAAMSAAHKTTIRFRFSIFPGVRTVGSENSTLRAVNDFSTVLFEAQLTI